MSNLKKFLDRCGEIEKEASPGPWTVSSDHFMVCSTGNSNEDGNDYMVCMNGYAARDGLGHSDSKTDAEFISFSRNTYAALLEIIRVQDEALKGILENVALDWYVQHFSKDESPNGTSSGIVAKIHNQETKDRIAAVMHRARESQAQIEEIVGKLE